MDLQALYAFYVTAKNGSISRASKLTGHAQPNISTKIQQLEKSTGKKLFHRHSRGVALTYHGETLYKHAVKIFELVERLEMEITTGFKEEKLSIGSIEITLSQRLPNVLYDFHNKYPNIELLITSSLGIHIVQKVYCLYDNLIIITPYYTLLL